MELNNQTEFQILEAAEKVFFIKGKGGTSMQDIADEAGITRTSLNYYYRTKDKLFEAVFKQALGHFIPKLGMLLQGDRPMLEYLTEMIEIIIDSMIEHPQIPVFVLQELTSNPDRMPQIMTELGISQEAIIHGMRKDEMMERLSIDSRHLITNIISMCIFPFAAKPMLVSIMYQGNEEAYIEAMQERKTILPRMLKQMIKSFEK